MDHVDALRLLVRLSERGSFSAAARALGVKQPTASKWIAELEAEVGVALVERTTRSVHFTDAGQAYLARARQVLAAFDEMLHEAKQLDPEPSGRVRISVPVVYGQLFVGPALVRFLAKHPRVEAEIVSSDRYVNLVEEGFDLAVRVGVPVDSMARGRKLRSGRRVLVASPAYVRAQGRPKTPRELRAHAILLHGDASLPTVWRFSRAGEPEIAVPVRARSWASSSGIVLEMAKQGLGIALLADWLVAADLAGKGLVPLLRDYETPAAPVYALTPPSRFVSPTVRAIVEHLARELA